MALPKLFQRIFWHNNTTPAINEDNLNAMSKGLSDVDDRLIDLAGTIMEDVPQIQEDIEELEEDFALIDEKIADATAEANRATTKANEAAASVISAGNKALISEGYAKGTQNGTPVGSSSPYYHNNAEYFKEQARSFTPTGYQDLVDDVAEAQEAITDIEGEKVSSNDAYVLRQCKGNMVDLDLVGGSVAWNQLIENGNFADGTTGWTITRSNATVSNNELTVNATAPNGFVYKSMAFQTNHKYLISIDAKGSVTGATNPIISVYYGTWGSLWTVNAKSTSYANYATIISANDGNVDELRLNSNETSITNKFRNVNVFDLTQKFGSTIADYIYSLEQATAGAGVAWFRQYFPNVYYAYNPGEIKSVNPSARKVVGKNLLKNSNTTSTISGITFTKNNDGSVTVNGTNSSGSTVSYYLGITESQIPFSLPEGQYILTGAPSGGGTIANYKWFMSLYYGTKASNHFDTFDFGDGATYTLTNSTNTGLGARIGIKSGTTVNNLTFKPMLRFASVTDSTYEPYKEYTFHFDSSKQLRGVPKLVDNKLSYDGDVYTADGTVTRKYGIVDLGTLYWIYSSGSQRMLSTSINTLVKKATNNSTKANIVCAKYINDTAQNTSDHVRDKSIAVDNTGGICIYDSDYSDAVAFTTAMSGVYLVYELATPTTESANAYQNPQRAFIDGTEEFVDAGVTASTRDVSIPVGNESEYNTSVVLPISQDYTDGAMEILKEIVASSSDFADFKTRVATL